MTAITSSTHWNEALALSCRRLFLRNYEVHINIGVHDFEKLGPQRVRVNVDMYVLLSQSTPKADRIHEVVDYDFIRRTIAARVNAGHIELQETLCDDVANTLLEHPKVQAVRVSTEKPDVYPDCDAVGVEVFRIKR
ncbi:dihydroneopterin aldolase [Brachymonas denitrificans]|jgi:dihydroneopterin aldolase|uniref:dihydroneopterin aldolase n=1 Tax=Brachymonas denitrificans DSM 15123 TaxID=1121117 RepID=A0A1H8E7U6_9BURK|nr:dihydroneopterin aldolase [Brachymonas denitrificans]SEN14858.1 dihydroneopterin aldolase [Brachymonas denitrificans DSM 15123]